MILLLGGSRSRLSIAAIVLLSSVASLLFLFSDSVPTVKTLATFKSRTGFIDSIPNSYPYGAVVIAAQSTQDTEWVNILRPNWTIYDYDVDRPNNPDPRLRFPASRGHEAMVYLSFIIDHYDDLPWCAIFMHGHRDGAWHQEDDMIRIITGLNQTALARVGYFSLRCDWFPSCPAEIHPVTQEAMAEGEEAERKGTEAAIAGNWRLLFPDEKKPDALASPCCAQFAVTRQAVLGRPKSDYERLREWLLGTLLEDYLSGRVLEKLWAYLFLGEAVHCPPQQQCACEYFGRCEPHNWTIPETETGGSEEHRRVEKHHSARDSTALTHSVGHSKPPEAAVANAPARICDGRQAMDEDLEEAPLPEAYEKPREDKQDDSDNEGSLLEDNIEGGATDATNPAIFRGFARVRAALATKAVVSPTQNLQSCNIDNVDDLQDTVDGGAAVGSDTLLSDMMLLLAMRPVARTDWR